MLVKVDVKKCQSAESQKRIATLVEKSYFKEVKKIASHWYLGLLLKKKIRQRRNQYMAIKRAKENFSFEERSIA